MKQFETIEVKKRLHVVCESERKDKANYQGTGKALCGVVPKGHTLDWWIKRHARKFN